jgi:acyl-CoA synthetase (NDP forming)
MKAVLEAPSRDLSALFDPRSIAVVGASSDEAKWGGDLAARLARGEGDRRLYFVNRRGGLVQGREAYRSLRDLPEAPQMVILAVPAQAFEEALDDALAVGARALVGIFAGLGETGDDGRARERAAAARVREAGAVMVGPNCMGVADTASGLQAVAYLDIPPGGLAFVSQSGGLGEDLVVRALEQGVGFSRYVTLGNQADLRVTDVLEGLVDHAPTRVVAVYGEDLGDGRAFVRAARALVASGRPVVVLSPGRSAASSRMARSHTGSLAPDGVVLDVACRAAGVVRVSTLGELFDAVLCLLPGRRAGGRRLAIVSDGGGHGGLAGDAAATAGLSVDPLAPEVVGRVRAALPVVAGSNPFDFAIGTIDPDAYGAVVEALEGADGVDAVLAVGQLGYWSARFPHFEEQVAREREGAARLGAAAERSGTPVVVCSAYPRSPTAALLRAQGVPVYHEPDAAVRALRHLIEAGEAEDRIRGAWDAPGHHDLVVPSPAPPLGSEEWERRSRGPEGTPRSRGVQGAPQSHGEGTPQSHGGEGAPHTHGGEGTPHSRDGEKGRRSHGDGEGQLEREYWLAREALGAAGLAVVEARRVVDLDEALRAADDLGYPVALKALGALHKSDRGGVALGIGDDDQLRERLSDVRERLSPPAFSLEHMAPLGEGIELIAGCRWDRHFGPVLLVGFGGLYAEIFADRQLALAPVSERGAAELLGRLRGAALLTGARGRPPLDLAAAARAAAALSRFAAAHPEIAELEANPLLVTEEGVLALDARLVWAGVSSRARAGVEGSDHGT